MWKFSELKGYISLSHHLFLFLFLAFCLPSLLVASEKNHSIVLQNSLSQPEWMKLWNSAREMSTNGNNEKAVSIYRELFVIKPRIEEALREYVLVLMDLGEWKEAGQIMQKLLETDSSSPEYLIYSGRIALVQKRYEHASKHMGQVYTMSPDGVFAIEALKGQIFALHKLNRPEMVYPLMEQLYLLIPHEEKLIRQLAVYSKKLGNTTKALNYYTTLITEFSGTDIDFLESVPFFEEANNQEMLILCWKGYLLAHPFYIPFHEKLSNYYLKNNFERKALPHLLVQIAHGGNDPELFLQTGKLYLYQEGRPDKALYYYEEYRKRTPHDTEVVIEIKRIQAILAGDLLVIVENEGAWNLWRDLAKVIPDRLSVYYSMADQLKSLGKTDELLEVLEIINVHNPQDQKTLFQLAQLYFEKGSYDAASRSLDALQPEMQMTQEYLLLRVEIAEEKKDHINTLGYYRQYLQLYSKDFSVLYRAIQLAGELGQIQDLNFFYSLISDQPVHSPIYKKGSLLYADGLILNELFSKAEDFYFTLQQKVQFTKSEKAIVNNSLFTILKMEGRFFEAEQFLRFRLIENQSDQDTIKKLILINRLTGDMDNAWKWYEYLVTTSETVTDKDLPGINTHLIEKVHILSDSGQSDEAIEILEDFLSQTEFLNLIGKEEISDLKAELARRYYFEGEIKYAQNILQSLLIDDPRNVHLLTLDQLIDDVTMDASSLVHSISNDRLLDFAQSFENFDSFDIALGLCEKYLVKVPDSLRARVYRAHLLRKAGDVFYALQQFQTLNMDYPMEIGFKENLLELQFQSAKFTLLIEELAPQWKQIPGEDSSLSVRKDVPQIDSLPIHQQVLLAKSFWADKRYNDAIILYKSLLQPPVEVEFSKQIDEQDIQLILPAPQKTFLNRITFTSPSEPDRLTVVMGPEFTQKFISEPEAEIAATLYPSYRWQQIISRELSVRQDMVDGNFYRAMNEYQNILSENKSPESLYDLAGIYSYLGFLGKEAALYEIIKQDSPGYPDLDEASSRNSLKRLPRTAPFFSLNQKEGRDGYYDIKEQQGGIKSWFMPSFNHEIEFEISRIYSESLRNEEKMWRNHLEAGLRWSPVYDFDFLLDLGVDNPDGNYSSTFLYDLQINGRIGDGVNGYLGSSQDIVTDTVDALKKGIKEQNYGAGISLDFHPRLFGGADYFHRKYSDGNNQNQYELWTSYIIHSEPTLLKLRYGYEFSQNQEENQGTLSVIQENDHPYWSPDEYWKHLATLSFEHQLTEDILGRGAPSFYTLEYSFGYEIGGYGYHEAKAQIFLEMSRHFLLNSSIEYKKGADVEETNIICSLVYRW